MCSSTSVFLSAVPVTCVVMTDSKERCFAMKNRMFGGIGVVALARAIVGLVAFAQQGQTQEKKTVHLEHNEMMQACAKDCSDCQRACDSCATHCTHKLFEGKKEHLA